MKKTIKVNIKTFVLIGILTALAGCGESESSLTSAITLSRDGLSLIAQSKKTDLKLEEKENLLNRGNNKISQSKLIYQMLIAKNPKNGLYLNNYGWVQMKSHDLTGAEESFNRASKHRESIEPAESLDQNIAALHELVLK